VGAFHRLVDAGHSIVVVEHDLDVARSADWIIDWARRAAMTGRIVGQGPPEEIARLDRPPGKRCERARSGLQP
jgi:excinuclease ABC subunit A